MHWFTPPWLGTDTCNQSKVVPRKGPPQWTDVQDIASQHAVQCDVAIVLHDVAHTAVVLHGFPTKLQLTSYLTATAFDP